MSRIIPFDNKSARQEKRKLNKLAAVRDICEKWIEILPKVYDSNENITLDKQLVGFRSMSFQTVHTNYTCSKHDPLRRRSNYIHNECPEALKKTVAVSSPTDACYVQKIRRTEA
ncbi:hypothetical protein TNCV_4663091 [Trichonephila clavipes]|uniref:Uncharacterized protein n=1 Tax=Trichonephila clavipes TaxID=2585209 RepID=A0A8X6SCY0_TRICX|nr:hypothetical protein TNCV_4663091 [Trichonephila clavipes]